MQVSACFPSGYAHRYWWLLLLVTTLLAGCGTSAAQPTQTTSVARQQQTVDGLTIAVELPPAARVNQSQNFTITLTDSQGKPVEAADVYLDLQMPNERMGTNRPVAHAVGSGVYQADGVYIMGGTWSVSVITTVDGKEHRASFTTQVQP